MDLIRDLDFKFRFPPIRHPSDPFPPSESGEEPIRVPQPTSYNTRPRARQLSAMMIDGAMVLKLLHQSHAGGIEALLKSKKHAEPQQIGHCEYENRDVKYSYKDEICDRNKWQVIAKDHVPLCVGRPWGGVRETVLAAAKYGCGLQGFSPSETVETIWTYCAERIQSIWRGKKSRKVRKQSNAHIIKLYVCLRTLNYENECWLLNWLLKFNILHHATQPHSI